MNIKNNTVPNTNPNSPIFNSRWFVYLLSFEHILGGNDLTQVKVAGNYYNYAQSRYNNLGRFMKQDKGTCCCATKSQRTDLETGLVTWVIATDGKKVSVYEKSANCKISPFSPNCQCSVNHMNPEHIGEYLDAALVTGKFNRLILVGNKEDIKKLKNNFDEILRNRIEAEIPRDTINTDLLDKKLEKMLAV